MPNYPTSTTINAPGSSGYGINPLTGRYGPLVSGPASSTGTNRADYGVYDAQSGKLISVLTGKPYSGVDPHSGYTYSNGVQTSGTPGSAATATIPGTNTQINPNDPNQRYQAVNIDKNKDVVAAEGDLMKTFQDNAKSALSDFGTTLSNFKNDLASARTKANAATDITGTTKALTDAQGEYSGSLDASNAAYQKALADSAAAQRGVVSQANADLPLYDQATNNVIANQLGLAQQNFSRYKMGSATPTSGSSADMRELARAADQASAPMELAKVNQRYNILGSLAMPAEERIGAAGINYAGSFLPSIAGSRYGSATTLANTLQGLKQQVAGMSMQDATQFLTAAGIPAQMQQAILSGQINQLGQLGQVESANKYQGLQDLLGVNVSQPVGYNMGNPGYPSYPPTPPTSRYGGYPNFNGGQQQVAPQQPNQAPGGGNQGNRREDPNAGGYWNLTDGSFVPYMQQPQPAMQVRTPNLGNSGYGTEVLTNPDYSGQPTMQSFQGDINIPDYAYA